MRPLNREELIKGSTSDFSRSFWALGSLSFMLALIPTGDVQLETMWPTSQLFQLNQDIDNRASVYLASLRIQTIRRGFYLVP